MTGSRVLAFDFGLKRIGAATGNKITKTCQALTTVKANRGHPDWPAIDRLIDQWQPAELVVGLPISMAGEETEMSGLCRIFGASLTQRYCLPVTWTDERLSSNTADHLLSTATPAGKKSRHSHGGARDALAAQLILQTFFEG